MVGELERADHRGQAGVITELLVSEILDRLYACVEVEPKLGHGQKRPDFRVQDCRGNAVIVEATNHMGIPNELHDRRLHWDSFIHEVRRIVRPLPALVTVRAVGTPREIPLGDQEETWLRSAIDRAARTGTEVCASFGCDFSIALEADRDPSLAGRDSVLQLGYEPDGGIIKVSEKLGQITGKVMEKAERYSAFPRPLIVVVNSLLAFEWYDEYAEIEPLKEMLCKLPCDAVWLFCNLQPSNIGFCEHYLLENPQSVFGGTDHLVPAREASRGPLYEVLGLDAIWNRPVVFDRKRTEHPDGIQASCDVPDPWFK